MPGIVLTTGVVVALGLVVVGRLRGGFVVDAGLLVVRVVLPPIMPPPVTPPSCCPTARLVHANINRTVDKKRKRGARGVGIVCLRVFGLLLAFKFKQGPKMAEGL